MATADAISMDERVVEARRLQEYRLWLSRKEKGLEQKCFAKFGSIKRYTYWVPDSFYRGERIQHCRDLLLNVNPVLYSEATEKKRQFPGVKALLRAEHSLRPATLPAPSEKRDPSLLLDLPPEIRSKIFSMLFGDSQISTTRITGRDKQTEDGHHRRFHQHPITRVNRQLRNETLQMFYSSLNVDIRPVKDGYKLMDCFAGSRKVAFSYHTWQVEAPSP